MFFQFSWTVFKTELSESTETEVARMSDASCHMRKEDVYVGKEKRPDTIRKVKRPSLGQWRT